MKLIDRYKKFRQELRELSGRAYEAYYAGHETKYEALKLRMYEIIDQNPNCAILADRDGYNIELN